MTFAFQCPHCRQLFEGKPGMEGRNGKCIHCHQVFEIKKYVDLQSERCRRFESKASGDVKTTNPNPIRK